MDAAFQGGFASYSFSNIFQKLASLTVEEISKILNFDTELRKLERLFLRIQSMVDTIEHFYATFPTSTVKKSCDAWLEEANRLIYDVDDLIEEISLECCLRKADKLLGAELPFRLKFYIPHQISALVKESEGLVSEVSNFFMIELMKLQVPKLSVRKERCNDFSSLDETPTIGRMDQRKEVLEMLSSNVVSVICITGMAGIGKTTFAQFLFNDDIAFPLRIWVSVSGELDVVKITRSVIESVSKKTCKLMELEMLQSTLKELLQGKKFLVVLDDVWSEERDDWDKLYAPFKVGSEDSKFIITTRSLKVSSVVGATIFDLPTLSAKDCWEIMKQRLFSNSQLHNLDEVGFEMAKKCKGIPLAAKMLGSLIQCTPDEEWESIVKSNLWDLPQYETTVLPTLLLTYYSLAPHLKKCFAYCSLFPPNHQFEMNKLVLLWMAEGLIQPSTNRRLEDIGREYFKDLFNRSFFIISHQYPGQKTMYTMHEFTHHMAQLICLSICHRVKDKRSYSLLKSVRHLCLCRVDTRSMELESFPKCEKLRTFLWQCASGIDIGMQIDSLIDKLSILRVLDLASGGIIALPDSISNLKYLRYLNLTDNRIHRLPPSLANLSYLQTLVLRDCPLIVAFPKNFNNLTNLRHLEFNVKDQLDRMPKRFGDLVNLQTLDAFIVQVDEGYNIEELKDMACLGGSLCITQLQNVRDKEAAERAFLNMKPWIETLELTWTISGNSDNHLEVLTGLQPHLKLKELIINTYCGHSFPPWLCDTQSCMLKTIHLRSCGSCKTLPCLGELRFLENLIIEHMSSLETVNSDFAGLDGFVGFQSLKTLKFVNMPRLNMWKSLGDLQMSQLSDLKFSDCPMLTSLPPLGKLISLKNLQISGCGILAYLPNLPGDPVSIRSLIIRHSPIIKARYKVDGPDWGKVKTVPIVRIDGVDMPTTSQQG